MMRMPTTPLTCLILLVVSMLAVAGDGDAIEIVRQPGSDGKDSYVTNAFSGWDATNFGDNEYFQIMGIVAHCAAYVEFDISAIPAGATVNAATVTLWAAYLDGTIQFSPVVSPWDEMTITWNNRPGNWTPTLSYPISRGAPDGPCYWGCALSFDITGIVQQWVDEFNNGLLITADTGYTSFMMASSDNLTHPHPMLTVDYTEPLAVEGSTWGAIKSLCR